MGILSVQNEDCIHLGIDGAPAAKDAPHYRRDVDGLRAVAVLFVIGFHAMSRWVPGGFIGVDVFFVISGFLISSIIFQALDEKRFSLTAFYARRIRRIFPALITVFIAAGVVGWFTLMADGYRQLGKDIAAGAGFVSNIFLWRQFGYFDGDIELKPLVHLWSLGVEEQYYLLWPVTVFLIWKMRFSRLKLILSVMVLSFALNVGTVQFSPETAFYLPHTRFWELMVGCALAYVQLYKRDEFDAELIRVFRISKWSAHLGQIKSCLGLALIVASAVLVNRESWFPGWWALLPTLGTFLLMSAGEGEWINRKLLGNPHMVFIGLISYPLYLWHWPLLSFTRIVLGEPPAWARAGAVLFAFLLAWLTYQFVETPFRRSQRVAPRRFGVSLLIAAMLAVVGLSAVIIRGHELPARFSPALQQLTQYKTDEHIPPWRANRCFLALNREGREFDSSCIDLEPAGSPLVFLWGDSHAADLYPGLRHLQSRYRFRIAQYSSAECPPVLSFESDARRRFCPEINNWVWHKMSELRPEVVILAGQRWYENHPGMQQKFFSTLEILKKSGVRTIIVVGPNPRWQDPLPRSLFLNYYRAGSLRIVPERMTYNLDPSIFVCDQQLKSWVLETDAIYLSPVSVLCNRAGCLTRVQEDGATDLTAFDHHHFTETASRYVTRVIFGPVFANAFASEKPREDANVTSDSPKVKSPQKSGGQ